MINAGLVKIEKDACPNVNDNCCAIDNHYGGNCNQCVAHTVFAVCVLKNFCKQEKCDA